MTETVQDEKEFHEISKPEHYNSHPSGVECRDIKQYLMSHLGDVTKYVWRAGLKGEELNGSRLKDLSKAKTYLGWTQSWMHPSAALDADFQEHLNDQIVQVRQHEQTGSLLDLWLMYLLHGDAEQLMQFALALGYEVGRLEQEAEQVDPNLQASDLRAQPYRIAEDSDGDLWVYDPNADTFKFYQIRANRPDWVTGGHALLKGIVKAGLHWKGLQNVDANELSSSRKTAD